MCHICHEVKLKLIYVVTATFMYVRNGEVFRVGKETAVELCSQFYFFAFSAFISDSFFFSSPTTTPCVKKWYFLSYLPAGVMCTLEYKFFILSLCNVHNINAVSLSSQQPSLWCDTSGSDCGSRFCRSSWSETEMDGGRKPR